MDDDLHAQRVSSGQVVKTERDRAIRREGGGDGGLARRGRTRDAAKKVRAPYERV